VGQIPEEICDGEDNNCDGFIDEDLGTTTCGLGVCQVTVDNCVAGEEQVCTPNPGAATDEVCDGEDNNCDGATDEVCPPIFDVLISFSDGSLDPIEVCFTPDKPLKENAYPIVSLIKPVNPGFSEGPVSPQLDPCSELLSYCVYYTPSQTDLEVEIRIDEDPTNPVVPGYPGYETASFFIDPDCIKASSFCLDNGVGGSGYLQDPCDTDGDAIMIEFDPGVLVDSDGNPLPSGTCSAVVRIVEIDPNSIPIPPEKGVVLMFNVSFVPEGVLIKKDMVVKVTLRFELPSDLTQQEFADHLQVLYYDSGSNHGPAGWKSDGISKPVIDWNAMTISFHTNHFSTLAALSKQNSSASSADDEENFNSDVEELAGRGCSVTPANHHMSLGSGIVNTLIMFFPLVVFEIRKRRIQKKRKN
jgi:hypothetical protein